jgi:hypothetical protein
MASQIIHLAYCFDGWVFGGYIRDVKIRKQEACTDVDLMFPGTADVDRFVACLSTTHKVELIDDSVFTKMGMYMSPGIKRLVKLVVDNVSVDVCVFDGDIEDWKAEHSTDLSCNLFYMSRTVGLGIRYIPECYKHIPDPVTHLVNMTVEGKFERIWDSKTPSIDDVHRILKRIKKMKKRGFVLTNELCSMSMWDEIDSQEDIIRRGIQDYISKNS